MKNYNEEYFFLGCDGSSKYPVLTEDSDQSEVPLLRKNFISEAQFPFKLQFMDPKPKKPEMADYHVYSLHHVFNEKLKQVLDSFGLKDTQFVPTEIIGKKGEIFDDYYIIHTCNWIKCVNKQESKFSTFESGNIDDFDKLVLDNEALDKIPLEDRLVFAMEEQNTLKLFHISVVEKMLEAGAKGMTVYRISKWDKYAPVEEEISKFLLGE